MLRPRIIPCLLIHKGGLVKTRRFKDHKYVGDPLNAIRIFNEKEVDELIVLDIDASVENREPDYSTIKNLAAECRMPLCYGGGVRDVEQVEKIVSLGVEKVAMSSAVVAEPDIVGRAAEIVGSQSVVVVMDIRKYGIRGKYELCTHNAGKRTRLEPIEFAQKIAAKGCGEIVLNSVDRDGMMRGYDLDLVKQVREVVSQPITVLGGAGSLADIVGAISTFGVLGSGAGSLFVFKGKYRAVLINYPNRAEKDKILENAMKKRVATSR